MKYQQKLQEKWWLEKIKAGDPEVFKEIYNQYLDSIYRFIYFKVSNREEAEDLTSEVFLKTWQYLYGVQKEVKSLQALLYQIARNLVIDFYRQKSQVEILDETGVLERLEDSRQQSLLGKIDNQAEIINIERILKQLKEEYQEVIILHYLEEMEIGEIAQVLNKSQGAVRVLLHRALKVLKGYLEEKQE